jgi:hypothetical protein
MDQTASEAICRRSPIISAGRASSLGTSPSSAIDRRASSAFLVGSVRRPFSCCVSVQHLPT